MARSDDMPGHRPSLIDPESPAPLRVLVVTNMWPSAEDPTFGVFVAQQVADLEARGLEIERCVIDGRSDRSNYLRGIFALRRQLRDFAPDLVHAHYVLSGLVALLAGARRSDRPLIVTHHGIEVFEGWQAPLARLVSRLADHTLVISPAMAERLGLSQGAVLACGIDLEAFAPGDRSAARASLGLAAEAELVAWVGADRPEKRLALARAAVTSLRRRRPAARLHVVSGLPPETVPQHLQACDALLVTSTREGGPLVVKEALAVGLPVVSTDVGDVRRLIEDLPSCAVSEGQPEALASALERALSSGRLDARERLATYHRPAVAERLQAVYAELLDRKRRPGAASARPAQDAPARPASKPLRILILRQGHYPNDPRVRREAQALADRGCEVDILCLRGPGESARESVAGARVYRLPLGRRRGGLLRYALDYGLFFALALPCVGWLHARRRYQLVQVNTMPDFLVWAAWPARLAGAKVLLDFHELMPELFASKFAAGLDHPLPRLLARIETRAARWADACLAVSQPCLDRYLARGAPAERFTVVMNSADPRLFAPPPSASQPAVTEPAGSLAPAPEDAGLLRLVSHGTLVERYGYDLLIEAVARLRAEGLHLRLDILGSGEMQAALEAQVHALGLDDRVNLAGYVPLDQVAERLRAADIGVVANRSDPFTDLVVPTKLMEYAALGIPAVAPATTAIEAYFDAAMVRRFEPGDAGALAEALRDLALDADLRRSQVAAATQGFVAQYGWPAMAERYLECIEDLLRAPASGSRG